MERAVRTGKALNVMQKIPLEELVESYNERQRVRYYTSDLVVDKHPDYPNLSPSIWTVKLSVEGDGAISETVEPKAGLKSPNVVLVYLYWSVRVGHEKGKKDPGSGEYNCHIGPQGFAKGDGESVNTLELVDNSRRNIRAGSSLVIRPGVYLLVTLTLVDTTPTSPSCLETLYTSGLFSDCTLVCGGRDFPAHRAIVAAQPPVFAAMFQGDTTGICTIEDLGPDMLEALLEFMYTKRLTKAGGRLDLVWTAADKYGVEDLLAVCSESHMLQSLNEENAAEYGWFAHQHGLAKLEKKAAKIISRI